MQCQKYGNITSKVFTLSLQSKSTYNAENGSFEGYLYYWIIIIYMCKCLTPAVGGGAHFSCFIQHITSYFKGNREIFHVKSFLSSNYGFTGVQYKPGRTNINPISYSLLSQQTMRIVFSIRKRWASGVQVSQICIWVNIPDWITEIYYIQTSDSIISTRVYLRFACSYLMFRSANFDRADAECIRPRQYWAGTRPIVLHSPVLSVQPSVANSPCSLNCL